LPRSPPKRAKISVPLTLKTSSSKPSNQFMWRPFLGWR
jgi:hypothetical protein